MITKEALRALQNKVKENEQPVLNQEAFQKATKTSMQLLLNKDKMEKFKEILTKYGQDSDEMKNFILVEMGDAEQIDTIEEGSDEEFESLKGFKADEVNFTSHSCQHSKGK